MTPFKTLLGATALIVLAPAGVAFAGSPAAYFEKIDADASGTVSQAEFVAYKTADGKVTAAEAEAKFAKLAGEDGTLTLAELEAAMKAHKSGKSKDMKSSS